MESDARVLVLSLSLSLGRPARLGRSGRGGGRQQHGERMLYNG